LEYVSRSPTQAAAKRGRPKREIIFDMSLSIKNYSAMDKITRYQDAIISLLEEYAAIKPANMPTVEQQVVVDRERNHFAFVRLGWEEERFVYHCVMHFDIKEGKVWLQQNWTDQNLADELIAKGIDRQDIVLGFVPPYARAQSGYAEA
jgi:hypothetical protein